MGFWAMVGVYVVGYGLFVWLAARICGLNEAQHRHMVRCEQDHQR